MGRNLLVSFDGTWNTPDDNGDIDGNTNTNVRLFYEACAATTQQGRTQLKWYDKGVGTRWYNRLAGGVFGVGLSRNLVQGYTWLVDNYQDGDDIFIIGFSRGAYTARSLVGFLRNAGLIKRTSGGKKQRDELINEAYQLYRARDEGADSPAATRFRAQFSQMVRVRFLGVWDTVGALGIPVNSFDWFNRRYYQFHDTELSSIVENAFHALATDEHRENYAATMWDPKEKPRQTVEQRWFVGAHSNVGGGYKTRTLSNLTLRWMADKAGTCGLALKTTDLPKVSRRNYTGKAIDSYEEFLSGLYRITSDRYYRPIGETANGGEGVDEAVLERYRSDTSYRPKNPVGVHVEGLPDAAIGRIRG
ncbi:DUF2235 domain-containing protein [Parahaliea maris]|uniref:DUF2235 domain-containing protein n=1 Tax=Parahaliea maris TaxID=2716870 RepID=A0A5C8ZSA9_9GAMM|nr:DUF2235 domain-containing protein [Parahaliea maris]TXS91275.1 DUF2235 domain-containing protein [Parahaliea maris]